MPVNDKKYRIFISANEHSADAHCAGLIKAMKNTGRDIEFVGVGGPKMAEAGCRLLENNVSRAVMIYKAFAHVFRYYKLIRQIENFLKNNKVDLVIVCDSPSFNFHVAKAGKKAGIKTLFYVAPQLWAWGAWRISKLQKYCDKLCCILPFEQEWFAKRGIDATFVGNPLFDNVDLTSQKAKNYSDFTPVKAQIALMPGSRAAEIDSLWVPMQRISIKIRQKYPQSGFVAVAVDAEREKILKARQIEGFRCDYAIDSVRHAAGKADFSIVASGSATLEVASSACPMVIMYQSNRFLWHLVGCRLIKTKYLSLVNILAGRELVPEFMPYFTSIEPIFKSIDELLEDKDKLIITSDSLLKLVEPLARKQARLQAANIALDMLQG
jgi:lipid-A-disaccharide synthase